MTDNPDIDAPALPESWTASARETFEAVSEECGDSLSSAELAELYHACFLESTAERLDRVAADAGMVARGSTGQTILHPAVTEARLSRTAAAAILARLHRPSAAPAPTAASERGRRAAAARWSR